MTDCFSAFNEYFEIVQALTEEQITQGQRLRFQVFTLERQIFSQDRYPDGVECDAYDGHSVHSLLRHRSTGQLAAAVRLVLSDRNVPDKGFPIEKQLQYPLYFKDVDVRNLPRSSIAEISRFAISKQFRHRAGDEHLDYDSTDRRVSAIPDHDLHARNRRAEGRRSFPHISLGLLKAIVKMSVENSVQYWYAAMEPSFIRLLYRFGVRFHTLGPIIDYSGKRQPCIARVDELLAGIANERLDVWQFITDDGRLLNASDFLSPVDERQEGDVLTL